MYEVAMPKLSDSMEQGKIIRWKVHEGDGVREGDALAEIESDKAVMDLECFHDGVLAKVLKPDGAEVAVGEVIAYIASKQEAVGKEAAPIREAPKTSQPPAATGAKPPDPPASPDEELPPLIVSADEADVEEASYRLKTLARRVVATKHVIPHFYVTVSVEADALLAKKAQLKAKFDATVTHLVLFACVRALNRHPEINRSYDRGKMIRWKGIHLGVAVDTEEGLTVGVLRNAQDLSLPELVKRAGVLVEKARSGKLSAEERTHATFTVSNLGMFAVESFQPIVNPPSAVTLAVAAALPAPVVRNNAIRIGTVMKLTASCDHRIIDGVAVARFLKDLKALLEDPDALLSD